MFKVLTKGCEPTRGTRHSACVDLYASHDCTIGAGSSELVGLGVAIDERKVFYSLPEYIQIAKDIEKRIVKGEDVKNALFEETSKFIENFKSSHYLQLMLNDELSEKLIIANGVGVIDLDYKDEIKIRLHNPLTFKDIDKKEGGFSDAPIQIIKGEKIAQITLLPHKGYLLGAESDVERDGGFGSTDEQKDK